MCVCVHGAVQCLFRVCSGYVVVSHTSPLQKKLEGADFSWRGLARETRYVAERNILSLVDLNAKYCCMGSG